MLKLSRWTDGEDDHYRNQISGLNDKGDETIQWGKDTLFNE